MTIARLTREATSLAGLSQRAAETLRIDGDPVHVADNNRIIAAGLQSLGDLQRFRRICSNDNEGASFNLVSHYSDPVGINREMVTAPAQICQRFISSAVRNDPKETQDAQNEDLPTDAASLVRSHFCDGSFELGRQHQEVLGEPGEQLSLGEVGCSGSDPVELRCLVAKLHQLRLHVLHDMRYFGGCKPGELAHSSI